MKKKGYIASLISLLLFYGLANLILFLLIPDGRTDLTSFWIAWSFTFPFNVLTAVGITLLLIRSSANAITKVPILFTIQYGFAGIYLVAGLIFMLINKNLVTAVWIVEAIITVAFIVLAMYAYLGMSYISNSIEHTKKKVFYIRSLQADIDACIPQVKDNDEASKLLASLSDKIRFSDPMSHESLIDCELKIQDLVTEIVTNVSLGKLDTLSELVTRASVLIDSRNGKCKILK